MSSYREHSLRTPSRRQSSDPNSSELTPRRTTRKSKQPKKYGDYLPTSPSKRNAVNYVESDEEMEEVESFHEKPSALFGSDDVKGKDIFQFKSRRSKSDLQNKVMSALNSSQSMELPKTSSNTFQGSQSKHTPVTPRNKKNTAKKSTIEEEEEENATDNDYSGGSSSDFVPDESDNESESSRSSNEETQSDNEEQAQSSKQKLKIDRNESTMQPEDTQYFVTPDDYFMMHSSKKIETSDHTLAKMENLNINDDELEDTDISAEHKQKIMELNNSYRKLFTKWLYVLSENFNIILYGLGSKISIVQQFQTEKLKDFPCVVVNGFFPNLTVKSILKTIVIELLENTDVPSNIGDVVKLIDEQLTECGVELFLIIHNIDGEKLRNSKAQATLASLAAIPNVHLIATIDHINAPLLWDNAKLSKFRFCWWDVTTFQPYTVETDFESRRPPRHAAQLQLAALNNVYQSLTKNGKGICRIIIKYQLEHQKNSHYQGMPFKELYSKCREEFLVSSNDALRTQLKEFIDHKVVKMKRIYDGTENLIIPFEKSLLQHFLEQQS